jgi:hypothetical protein
MIHFNKEFVEFILGYISTEWNSAGTERKMVWIVNTSRKNNETGGFWTKRNLFRSSGNVSSFLWRVTYYDDKPKVWFVVLTAVTMKNDVFRDGTPPCYFKKASFLI